MIMVDLSDFFTLPPRDCHLQFTDDVVGISGFRAEADIYDHWHFAVVRVSSLRPVLCTFHAIVFVEVGQHYDDFNLLWQTKNS